MTRKSEWTGMSPGSSDSARGSSSHRWDSQSSFYSSLKGDQLEEEESFVDDKETASSAVAFVVHSSRKGIIHLCADVANLIKAKKRLEHLVKKLKEDNAQLKQLNTSHGASCCSHTSRSTTPSPPSVDSSDYHCPRGRRKGSLFSGSANRQRDISPSLSTSTLTSPGEEVGQLKQETGRHLPSRRRRTLTPQRNETAVDGRGANHSVLDNLVQDDNIFFHESYVKPALGDENGHHGNHHKIKVDVHRSPHLEDDDTLSHKKVLAEGKPALTLMESVGVQCSLCEVLHRDLQRQIDEVEEEKTGLERNYLKIQDETERLKVYVQSLENDRQMKDSCIVEIENELMKRNIPHSKPSTRDDASTQLLPHLITEHISTNHKVVKSLSRITCGCTIHLEDRIMMKGDRIGRVRYIGPLQHLKPSMVFVGVQLDSAAGRHDGSIHGCCYFTCPKLHGVFIPVQDVYSVLTSKYTKKLKSAKAPSSIQHNVSSSRNKKRITPVSPSSPVTSDARAPSRPISTRSQARFNRQQNTQDKS